MKKSKHIHQTCLIIVENLNQQGDHFEIGACQNYTNSMVYECQNKLPELTVISVKTYDEAMSHFGKFKYVFVSSMGNYIEWYNFSYVIDRMAQDNIALVGHILDKKGYYELHDQLFVLDVDKWKIADCPHIRNTVTHKAFAIIRDENNIHHDYTPRWIKADIQNDYPYKIPVDGMYPGSLIISEFIGKNFNVSAFNDLERKHKYYLYGGTEWFYPAFFLSEAYAFCNEPLSSMVNEMPEDIEQYFGIASPYYIIALSLKNKNCKQWNIFDNSQTQLLYCKWVLENLPTFNYDVKQTYKGFLREYPWIKDTDFESIDTNPYLQEIVDFIQQMVGPYQLGNVKYIDQNIWVDQKIKINDKPTLAYTSNVFRYQPASKLMPLSKQTQAENKFLNILRNNKNIHYIVNDMQTERIR